MKNIVAVLLLAVLLFSGMKKFLPPHFFQFYTHRPPNTLSVKYVAHALGRYKGKNYLNCLECFKKSYAAGFRIFEMDFSETKEGQLVGLHESELLGLKKDFTLEDFKKLSTPEITFLDEDDVAELMKKVPDWYLVTDVKDNNLQGLRRLCSVFTKHGQPCEERVIPQLYEPKDAKILDQIRFKRAIFSLYHFGNKKKEVYATIDKYPQIWGVTMWVEWWDEDYATQLHLRNVLGFVHTIDDRPTANKLFAQGVDGIYTNTSLF